MKLRPYPEYKDSRVEWLGSTPSHWSVFPLRFMASDSNSLFIDGDWVESKDLSDSGIRYLTTGNVGEGVYKEQGSGYISDEKFKELNCTEVLPGDVLISRLNLPIARACLAPDLGERVISSVDIVVFRPDASFNRNFIIYLLSSKEHFENTENLARGTTMQRISRSSLGRVRFLLPSYEEQSTIASFLDRETSKLDNLIAKQEHLIDLLQEKRQAIISHAVTKGLNPDAKMKDSGVEWLGMVPEVWEAASIKWFTRIYSGGTPDKSNDSYWTDGTIPWLNSGSVNDDIITEPSNYITEEAFEKSSAKWIPKNALVIALAGQGKTKGMVAQLAIDTTCNQSMAAIIPISKISSRFLFWWLKANYQNIRNLAGGDLRDGLNLEMIGGIYTPIPPLTDQYEITEFLDRETNKIDILIDKAKHSIELAKEHRSALISAAVTGKIDVREAV